MGKTKHDAKYDRRDILKPTNILKPEKASKPAKHVASTSKIFKNAKHHQSHKSKYDEGILKTRKPLQEKRLPSKYKYKLVSEHYLAAKLNGQPAPSPKHNLHLTRSRINRRLPRQHPNRLLSKRQSNNNRPLHPPPPDPSRSLTAARSRRRNRRSILQASRRRTAQLLP